MVHGYEMEMKPWEAFMEPFRIFGNLYFVGNKYVSSHVIDTGEGLILLDSNYPECTFLLTEGMRKLGLNPYDIKYILHSHGHYDHIGGTRALVEYYGAKTIIGAPDVPFVNGSVNLTWANELGFKFTQPFEPDIILNDGDVFKLGKTKIRAVSTPGHSPGTMSFFFNVDDGETSYIAGMQGGAGVNSMTNKFLKEYNLQYSCREEFVKGLEKIKDEHVDILIGNHPGDVDTAGKYEKMLSGAKNPFIDNTALKKRIEYILNQFNNMVESGI